MANEPDAPDSRPISVSELLARSREAGGATSGGTREGRGRRRVGREGSVSVSELTGEIPRVRSADDTDAGTAEPETDSNRRPAPEPPAADGGRDETGSFPRSANPVARRYAEDRPVADRSPSPFPPAKSGPTSSAPPSSRPSGPTASGMPGYASPSTRDFSASPGAGRGAPGTGANRPGPAPRGRASAAEAANANAVTGIIPVVGDSDDDELVVVEPDDVDGYDLASPAGASQVTDEPEAADDFEAYRAFADIDEEPEPPKRRFGWLKNKQKKTDRSARPAAAREREQFVADEPEFDGLVEPDHVVGDTDPEPDVEDLSVGGTAAFAAPTVPEPSDPADARTEYIGGVVEDAETEADHTDTDPGTDGPAPDDLSTRAGRRRAAAVETARAEALDPVATTSDRDVAPANAPAATADEQTEAERTDAARTVAEQTDDEQADKDTKRPAGRAEHSPAVAWLLVIGQSIAGLVIGVGLFWGFTELWKWNVYFALVLAVLVIFGIVTFAHLVRRTKDLTTTLLALGVGLIVTIGPLVLLAT
ncbi:hypothetical protein GTV32_20250 [Gordonia sp. SID5947]|uniref:hypothetical protein n=1 Tax=Gordonia sp. SID5947 TaxID=2690315 RepID=UPI00136E976B|nr:hypothetical protein [Gordonia sp. SID5947]MYR08490.1 hypothetical protein [Gordonia sp. SID5947]